MWRPSRRPSDARQRLRQRSLGTRAGPRCGRPPVRSERSAPSARQSRCSRGWAGIRVTRSRGRLRGPATSSRHASRRESLPPPSSRSRARHSRPVSRPRGRSELGVRAPMITPPLVERALGLPPSRGFESSCRPEEGALLHVLAARRGIVRAAEIGTGAGVGAAWIVSALPPETPFFTRGGRAGARGRQWPRSSPDDPNVSVLLGSWRDVLPREAPFDLLFVDADTAKDDVEADGWPPCTGRNGDARRRLARPQRLRRPTRCVAAPSQARHDRALGHTRAARARLRAPLEEAPEPRT